jgi:N6-adenosine-specific RNA methylase IME4
MSSISQRSAVDIVTLPKEQQQEIVAKGEDEILKAAMQIRKDRSAANKQKRDELKKQALSIKPPDGKYRTIVIDPPWEMEKIQRDLAPNQVDFDYPTMSLDDIKNFDIPAHEECHLWLWTTQKYLPDAYDVLKAWDFKYLVTFVWHKNGGFQPVGLPQYNCEFVLLARKGGQPFLDTKQFFTCFNAPRREHSRKPDEFYDLVKRVSPEPRIDIFSREEREGYDVWGVEKDYFDE